MTNTLQAVFALPPEDVSEAEFEAWYPGHLQDLLAIDGLASARRYELTTRHGTGSPAPYRYLALYEIAGDVEQTGAAINAGMQDGTIPLPEFFGRVRWAVFNFVPLDASAAGDPMDCDHTYLVFSAPPAGVPAAEYDAWYHRHIRENLQAPGFIEGWRWRPEPLLVDPASEPTVTHLGMYRLDGEWPFLNEGIEKLLADGAVYLPDWFPQIDFISLEAAAITPRVRRESR